MNDFSMILLSVGMFTLIVLVLVIVILLAKSRLVPKGRAKLVINNSADRTYHVPLGGKLINTLADQEIFVPSACGGGGTCGLCKVVVKEGGGSLLSTEASILKRGEIREGFRLACQVPGLSRGRF